MRAFFFNVIHAKIDTHTAVALGHPGQVRELFAMLEMRCVALRSDPRLLPRQRQRQPNKLNYQSAQSTHRRFWP